MPQAVDSHAAVDQALGVLPARHRTPPPAGFDILRETSQHLNIKLRLLAALIAGAALGRPLSARIQNHLGATIRRHSRTD
ncbi:ANTAR domain-containing protein [Streptomyces typhae]|uniref:ANTAR domain-containing protein n=1 Tax=Streptomyces typhae TaxID=2681492 RepID=UPI002483CAEA|nr:ANTAR domain-containing protein [Streptomyces typhae]